MRRCSRFRSSVEPGITPHGGSNSANTSRVGNGHRTADTRDEIRTNSNLHRKRESGVDGGCLRVPRYRSPARISAKPFADGEMQLQILENVRGVDAFAIQPTCTPVERNLFELLLMIDALKRASAERITAVLPYYGYARQDRKDRPRVPISAKLVASLLERAGADRILAWICMRRRFRDFSISPWIICLPRR